MTADADVQVWLETMERTRPVVVVPYVVSENARGVQYRIRAVQDAAGGGRAVIGQKGEIQLQAKTPAALSRFSLQRRPGDHCEIEIILEGGDMRKRHFVFECPS